MDSLGENGLVSESGNEMDPVGQSSTLVKSVVELARQGLFDQSVSILRMLRADATAGRSARALTAYVTEIWPQALPDRVEYWADLLQSESDDDSIHNLAVALWGVDELGLAENAMRLGLDRGDEQLRVLLGEAQMYLGKTIEAERNLRASLESESESGSRAAALLGRYYFREQGRTDADTEDLLSRGSVEGGEFVVDLAELLLRNGQSDKAIDLLRTECLAGNPLAPIVLGNYYSDVLGDFDKARDAYMRGIELGDAFSAHNLAALLDANGMTAESSSWLKYASDHGDVRARTRLIGPDTQNWED